MATTLCSARCPLRSCKHWARAAAQHSRQASSRQAVGTLVARPSPRKTAALTLLQPAPPAAMWTRCWRWQRLRSSRSQSGRSHRRRPPHACRTTTPPPLPSQGLCMTAPARLAHPLQACDPLHCPSAAAATVAAHPGALTLMAWRCAGATPPPLAAPLPLQPTQTVPWHPAPALGQASRLPSCLHPPPPLLQLRLQHSSAPCLHRGGLPRRRATASWTWQP